MIARLGTARHTADVDLVAKADSVDAALDALRLAAGRDLGDFFAFRFEAVRALVAGRPWIADPDRGVVGPADVRAVRRGSGHGIAEKTLDEALPLAKRFIDPALAGQVTGSVWDPAALAWRQVTATS